MATRINKYLSEVGYCSRRVADRLIGEGKVVINGKIPDMGSKINEGDQVEVEGQKIENTTKRKHIYLAFNKPVGIVCTTNRKNSCRIFNEIYNIVGFYFSIGCANNSYWFIKC